MPESLMVIRSSSTLRKHWEWMTFSADSVSSVHTLTDDLPLESLADQPGAGNVHLLIPPEGLLYRSLTLPNAKYKLTAQTLQWLAEETLPDNTQDWHWTVVDKQNESVEVIGIQSEKLSRYLERLHTAGLNVTRVLPDGCYLPWEVDSWTLVNQQTSWLIRSAAHAFNELDEHWLQHLAAQFPPENMLCYGVVPHGVAAANPLIQHPEIPSLSLYSADIAFQRYDMLHGIFRKQKTVSKSGKWLARLAVSCLVLAILSFVGSRSIALWHTLKIEDQLQQQQQETWQRYFPQIKRTHNFRFYFKQQLAQQYPEAVPLLYHLQTLLLEHPELQLMEANYSQKQKSLTLKMSAKSEANIDRFCELTQSWLPMEKTEKDPVSGVWTVRKLREMIKSWWAEKSTSEKQIVAALAVLSLGVFCWLGVIKPIDTYIAEHQSHAQKIKKDIKWMQDQASTHGLLGHPALTQPIKNILLEEAKRENLAITLENGPDNTLTIHPVTAPLENVSRWLTTAQVTYGIVIEDLQFTLAGNEEITLRHLSFREQQ